MAASHGRAPRRSRRCEISRLEPGSGEGSSRRSTDQTIESELKEALRWGDPELYSSVRIRVREGTVFLTGEVGDFDSFRSLHDLVLVTPGVRYVKNGVLVIPEEEHEPPVWISE